MVDNKNAADALASLATDSASTAQTREQDSLSRCDQSIIVGSEEAEKVRQLIARADAWLAANQQVWSYMTGLAANEVRHQRRFSFRWLCEQARARSFVDNAGEPFRLNNYFTAYLARVMLRQNPGFTGWMSRLRRSVFDGFMDGQDGA